MLNLWDILAVLTQFTVGLIFLAIAVEAITEILVSSKLLDIIGIRTWAANRVVPLDGDYSKVRWYHVALHKLLSCGYCASVWVAGAFAWCLSGDYFGLLPWDNIAIKIFLLHRLSNAWHVRYELVKRGRVDTADIKMSLEVSDARAIRRGDGAANEEIGRTDFQIPSHIELGGHQTSPGGS